MFSTPSLDTDFEKYDEMRLHMEAFLSANLVEFDISPRILCPLYRAGIRTLRDLTHQSATSLRRIQNIGALSVKWIEQFLHRWGLHLAK